MWPWANFRHAQGCSHPVPFMGLQGAFPSVACSETSHNLWCPIQKSSRYNSHMRPRFASARSKYAPSIGVLLFISILCLSGCGGRSQSTATASCSASTVLVGQQLACTSNEAVTWSASAGSIDNHGVFTAPGSPAAVTITATSNSGAAVAQVTVAVEDFPILYSTFNNCPVNVSPSFCANIAKINSDGSGYGVLTNDNNDFLDQAEWFPDGKQILFTDFLLGPFIMKADGSGRNALLLPPGFEFIAHELTLSPDGNSVIFVDYRRDVQEWGIFVASLNGAAFRQITHIPTPFFPPPIGVGPPPQHWPTLSPDGKKVAFTDSTDQLWTVNSDGTNAAPLTSDKLGRVRPAWSPDGTKIAASIASFPNPIVQVIDVTTGAVNSLAQGRQPSWSFDGKRLVFENTNSDPNNQVDTDVFMINIDGTGKTRVTPNRNVNSARWFR